MQNIQHLRHADKSIDYVCEALKIKSISINLQEEIKIHKFECLAFRSVDFKFGDAFIYRDLNLEINRFDFVAIIGGSGSGKSTVLSLLMGLLNPHDGSVIVNGHPIKDVIKEWHDLISYVPQDVFIMEESLFGNVSYGSEYKNSNTHELRAFNALERAELEPKLLVKTINEKMQSSSMSGGQKQRIALARAFYRDRDVLILDEFTSALDPKTVEKILENLLTFKGKKTVIMVTHNTNLLKICNKIIDIDKIRVF